MSFLNLCFIQWCFVFSSIFAFADQNFFHTDQLPNGLTYYIHPDLAFRKHISLDLVVRVGSATEQEDEKRFFPSRRTSSLE